MELMRNIRAALLAATLFSPAPALAQDEARPAIGVHAFVSSDSEDTDVQRLAVDFDLRNAGEQDRLGIRVEKAWYDPLDTGVRERERVFLQAADSSGPWDWRISVGTDGDTVIGSASVNDDARFRKEFFIERDVVETPRGLDEGIYSTYAGAALDLPIDDRNIVTVLGGVQAFTGDNVRLHARANYVHVIDPDLGLSAQLRGRYFTSSDPGEFDYYSPEWYAELLPVLQMRRFVSGWQLLGAGGIGVQRDSESDWRQANYLHARAISPPGPRDWSVRAELTYTDTPSNTASAGEGYSYFQAMLGVTRRF
ncbi:hypothetical protein [Aurantiacibacter aquimixticola]|uniref:DUF481 domain-containing protein n=1 Tax=Aurantiacibacter aquimixticola TaxID=1958945 RepID=A0A419RTZ0_9SPHN|nr:hypothetical protein [Aurantiacibacter aquimixticola]RJY09252.1 hypothetical protein D6201_07680 [Aurantiacibacter aquimixticola]